MTYYVYTAITVVSVDQSSNKGQIAEFHYFGELSTDWHTKTAGILTDLAAYISLTV